MKLNQTTAERSTSPPAIFLWRCVKLGEGGSVFNSLAFRDGVHIKHGQPTSGQSRVYRVTQLRTDGVPRRESVGTGPVVLKVVPVADAPFSGITIDHFMSASLLPHPLLV